ncbi:MAG: sugar ABC transporter permease [Blastochloris sp.]|nr:sugar ABC transporter permease [Blastochloris sp.]
MSSNAASVQAQQPATRARSFNSRWRQEAIGGWLLLLPMLILTVTFSIYPVFRSLQITMYNWQGIGQPTQYVGLRHFQTVLNDPWFWNAFGNTLQYTLVLVPIQLTLALMLALILSSEKFRFVTFFRTIYFLPVVTSVAIVAIVVRLMLQQGGVQISQALELNPPINPIGNPNLSMWSVTGFGIWYSFGINLVYFMAALQTVPEELYDAAKVDGANWFQRLSYVTLPSIRPVATIILFFAIFGSMQVFEQSFVLTSGGPFFSSEVVTGYIYTYAFGGQGRAGSPANLGYASAASFIMNVLVLLVTFVQLAVVRGINRSGR